jgi:hypothetical protein
MNHGCLALLLSLALALPAYADVTLKMAVTASGMGASGKTSGVAYIKGNKMRSDLQLGNRTQTTVLDLDAQKMYVFESGKKEADVWDMADFAKNLSSAVDTTQLKGSLTPNGQTKQIGSLTASGYDMLITGPAPLGGNKDMAMNLTLSGPVWIVKDAPGAADYNRFYKAAVEKGWIFGDPRAAKAQPGQARAMTEMYRQFVEIGGIAYETDVQIKISAAGGDAGGFMSGMLAKMGNISSKTTIEDVQTGPLSDDLFAPPAGYKLNTRK